MVDLTASSIVQSSGILNTFDYFFYVLIILLEMRFPIKILSVEAVEAKNINPPNTLATWEGLGFCLHSFHSPCFNRDRAPSHTWMLQS